jgi:hypothetical protein
MDRGLASLFARLPFIHIYFVRELKAEHSIGAMTRHLGR